jgi:hypothetical protein
MIVLPLWIFAAMALVTFASLALAVASLIHAAGTLRLAQEGSDGWKEAITAWGETLDTLNRALQLWRDEAYDRKHPF